VQFYRFAKSEIIAQDRAKEAADIARERNEFRLMRIEREKQERAQKHAQKAAGARAEAGAGNESAADAAKKAAIAAALERAKAQKSEVTPQNTESVSAEVSKEIADIDARREAVKVSQIQDGQAKQGQASEQGQLFATEVSPESAEIKPQTEEAK
jgi:electron transport complex protein RnfC